MALPRTVISISSDSTSAIGTPPPQPTYYGDLTADDSNDEEGRYRPIFGHLYRKLRRIYWKSVAETGTGSPQDRTKAIHFKIDMEKLESPRRDVYTAVVELRKATTAAEVQIANADMIRLTGVYDQALRAQDARNWANAKYRELYSYHIQLLSYTILLSTTMELMVADAPAPDGSTKILDMGTLAEYTNLRAAVLQPPGGRIRLDAYIATAVQGEPQGLHIGIKDYVITLCFFIEELERRMLKAQDPKGNQGDQIEQIGREVMSIFLQFSKPNESLWNNIWHRVEVAWRNMRLARN